MRKLVLAAMLLAGMAPPAASAAAVTVKGNQLLEGGKPIQLRGVNRSGTEYACLQGWGIADSPTPERVDGRKLIRAMTTWKINVVRVPLNEDCWLGINTDSQYAGKAYRKGIRTYVKRLHAAGLIAILDLHVAAPGTQQSIEIAPMPDADHAPDFWRSLARTFKRDKRVIFDLYNEPHDVGWDCWRDGCQIAGYKAAGMQDLVDAVRSTGARQPLLVGGIDYAGDPSEWVEHAPKDPARALILSNHNYGVLHPCETDCKAQLAAAAKRYPVVIGELGQTDCAHDYVDPFMRWADRHDIGYLGWAWDAVKEGGWQCDSGPALITDYEGTPTAFGVGMRDHFRARARG